MIQDQENLMHFIAEDGKVIVPKDREGIDFFMAEDIWIGSADSIDNYEEIDKPVEPEPAEPEPTEVEEPEEETA